MASKSRFFNQNNLAKHFFFDETIISLLINSGLPYALLYSPQKKYPCCVLW